MPVVRVKGVANPMQFPDDMDINDIRKFLRKRFANQAVAGNQPMDLAPLQGQARASEQSLAQKAGQGISNALVDSGIISDRFGAQQIGKNVTSIGEFLPGIGDATAGDEFGRALKQGDNFGMAMGALGAIPLIGDAAKKGLKSIKKITDLQGNKIDAPRVFHRGEGSGGVDSKSVLGDSVWDNSLFASSNKSSAEAYIEGQPDGNVTELIADDSANILYEGTKEYRDLLKGVKGASRTDFPMAKEAAKRAKNAGYDALWFKRQGDFGTLIFDRSKFEGQENLFNKAAGIRQPSTDKAMSVGGIKLNNLKDVPYREQQKIAKGLQTGQPVEFYYSRNLEKAPKITGMDFGQSIEPAGRYMNVDFTEMSGGKNWETGTIKFNNPLVVEHKNTNSTGWKKDLSDKYGGSVGKRLSNKIKKDGYDAIITVDDYGLSETISLR